MLIDTLTVKLIGDATGLHVELEKAGQKIVAIKGHSETANHGLNILRRGFESLALQATGISGPIGRVSQGLLQLGAGSTAVLGVAAGIGLIAGAWKLASADADAAAKHTDELRQEYIKLASALNPLIGLGQQYIETQKKMAQAQLALLDSSKKLGVFTTLSGAGGLIGSIAQAFAGGQGKAVDQIIQQIGILNETLKVLGKISKDTADEGAEAFRNLADAFKVIQGNVAELVNDPNFQTFLQSIGVETNFAPTKTEQGFANMANFVKGGAERGAPLKAPGTSAEFLKHGFEPAVDEMGKYLKERGAELGAAFIMAIAQGSKNMGDFLKQVMLEIANMAILKVFKVLLKIHSPSVEGIDIGKNFSLGLAMGVSSGGAAVAGASSAVASRLAGSAAFSLNMSGMPPAMNPLAAARDQDYQRFFREGALVAKAAGFQFA